MLKRAAGQRVEAEPANPAVACVLDLIGRRFAEPYSSADLVRATGMSISHLAHLFTAHMGMGIKQYATQLRILKACELLVAEPELKIESVARAVGFKYAADFNRAFKARTRMTPAVYRDTSGKTGLHKMIAETEITEPIQGIRGDRHCKTPLK